MLPFVCPKVGSFVFCEVVVLGGENNARTLGGFTDFFCIFHFLEARTE